ncbi:nucleoside monophosphate kinase [Candidatus Pacearchaeota archaeon]|nr:nucleoside monophosphate kinase [Candidatus Pacearchaeota archaeon]
MKLAIIGIQGSGKGTQAKLLAKEFKLKRISIGEIARKEIKKGSRKGKVLAKYMNSGKLAPNRIINKLIKINTPKDNFIIDGFPRDKRQLRVAKKINLDKVILLTLPKKEVYKRIKLRRKLEKRPDDQIEKLETRLKLFYKHSPKIIKYFKDKLIKINGNQPRKKVFSDIKKALKEKN